MSAARPKHPRNRLLFHGANRGHDSLASFRIGADGGLTQTGIQPNPGKGPQNGECP
jgi:6-phosphogluconolactonase (cycloisomerase 2 family)